VATTTRNIGRLTEIAQVAVRHGFGYFFERHRLSDLLPWGTRIHEPETSTRGARLREMLDELGPTFVKFGQLLSTRPDVVPPDVVVELRKLQDDVRPFGFDEVRAVVEQELGLELERLFLDFEEVPIAAASIGQVHRAVLPNGDRVAVKVQRPGAPRQIQADLSLLYQAARIAQERVRALDFVDVRALVDEFAHAIRQELDYTREGRNAETFRNNFRDDSRVLIPKVYWTYTRERVLTLEFLDGIQLVDLPPEAPLDQRRRLAVLLTDAWMQMIFRHGFLHGDPHPANILIMDGGTRIGLVDFGQIGRLTDDDMARLTRLFVDAAQERVDMLPRRLQELGVRYPAEKEADFRARLHDLYYRYYGARLAEIDPLEVIRDGFDLIYSMNLRLPHRFLLLDKAIATLGSVGVELYPDFNVFEVARPYARSMVFERFTPERLAAGAQREGLAYVQMARELPYQIHDVLEELRDGRMEVGFVHKGLDDFMHRMDVIFNRLVMALVVSGGLIGSSLIGIFAQGGPQLIGVHIVSVLGFLVSGALALWLFWGVVRSGRL
jgi:ubiquinone biosynthesis protein